MEDVGEVDYKACIFTNAYSLALSKGLSYTVE